MTKPKQPLTFHSLTERQWRELVESGIAKGWIKPAPARVVVGVYNPFEGNRVTSAQNSPDSDGKINRKSTQKRLL